MEGPEVSFLDLTENGSPGGLGAVLFKNLGLKLLALAFATALWFFVVGEKESELRLMVPVALKGIPGDMVMVGDVPGLLEVRVSGSEVFINKLSPSEVSVAIDLSGAGDGLNTLRVSSEEVMTPRGVEVVKVSPSSVEVTLERLVTTTLPVKVRVRGKPAKGFTLKGVTSEPMEVEVTGRKKDLKRLKRIYTKELDITGFTETVTEELFLDIADKAVTSVEPDTVNVTVEIEKRGKKK